MTVPDLSDQDDRSNVRVLAKALVFARTGEAGYAQQVRRACRRIQGTERQADTLSLGRELVAYVVAADLVGLDGEARETFEGWLRRTRGRSFRGRSLGSAHRDRPNNWGTHAGASRLAIAAYLGDRREIERSAIHFASKGNASRSSR